MNARVEFAKGFKLYQPIFTTNEDNHVNCNADCGKFTTSTYSHFPYLTEPDGSLWEHGNLYLLSKFKDVSVPILGTLESLARDLKCFRLWTLNEGIDYLQFSSRKLRRPTYKYHGHLSDLVLFGEIKNSTAKRRMNTIENFYNWLVYQGV